LNHYPATTLNKALLLLLRSLPDDQASIKWGIFFFAKNHPPKPQPQIYATSWIRPPASVILRSASLLTYRALITKGTLGRRPFPRTLA
jgi:hypothetical protein